MPEDIGYEIDLTIQEEPIVLEAPAEASIELNMLGGDIYFLAGLNVFTAALTQVDVDNKFIVVSALASIVVKERVAVFIDNVGLQMEYAVDYTITADNKINWDGYQLDGRLSAGDKLKVYY